MEKKVIKVTESQLNVLKSRLKEQEEEKEKKERRGGLRNMTYLFLTFRKFLS